MQQSHTALRSCQPRATGQFVVRPRKGRTNDSSQIRVYRETDWGDVCAIYDLAKPDEMKGLVEAHDLKPLAQDDQMLRYFDESQIWVYESNGSILGFIGRKNDQVSWLFVHPNHRRKGVARK
jgi:hypothetical protein